MGEQYLICGSGVKRGKLLGRGAFGFVFQGTCSAKLTAGAKLNVAIKALQPVSPGPSPSNSALIAYKVQSYYFFYLIIF